MFRSFLVFAILLSHCLLAQPFFFRKDIRVREYPYGGVAAGDFNGDRRPDLAVSTPRGLFILLNEGGGNFGQPILTETTGEGDWLVADFNGDGKDDLVGSGSGLVLLSRGDGTFLPPRRIEVQAPYMAVLAVGDFNRDGKSDLLVGGPFGTSVLLGNGDGTFQSAAMVTNLIGAAAVADFNRDGRLDVALDICGEAVPGCASSSGGRRVSVLLGKGDGTFAPEIRTPLDSGWRLGPLLAADFNGDGIPDIATSGGILLGKGDGSFQAPVPYPSEFGGMRLLAAADFTGDGYADLVMGYYGRANHISIYPGKGDGTLLPPVEQPVGWAHMDNVARLPAVDLDGDGRLDLVVPNWDSITISLLMSKSQGGPALVRALSTASDTAIVAPESLATLMTATPADAGTSASPPWPTRLGGISLEVSDSAGAVRLAPLVFVSPSQINFRVPADTALGEATLAIVSDRGTSQAGSMQVDAAAPGLFVVSREANIPAATAVRVDPDGTQVPIPVFSCSGTSCKAEPVPLSAAWPRPIYLSFFGTGFRGANSVNVTCSIYGVQVPVVYAGPQGTPGVDQINVRLPLEVLAVSPYDRTGLTIRVDGMLVDWAEIVIE